MSTSDFVFAWEGADASVGPWRHLEVAQLRGVEAISSPYRYELLGLARDPAPEIDPDAIVGTRGSLRIATATEPPFRVVHGIVSEAEELGPTQGGLIYRLVLSPPIVRAQHRERCRVFLEKTTRQIIDAVLLGDPDLRRDDGAMVEPYTGDMLVYEAPRELFAWRVMDTSRIDQIAARPYCVQYNESDFAFVSRLLEEEGIAYHYEHGDGVCLLVLSDKDAGRARLSPFSPLGEGIRGREVSSMRLGARFRPRKVSMLDYNWRSPALDMGVHESDASGRGDLMTYTYPGGYPDTPDQGRPLATARLERLEVEASYAVGEGGCRLLTAGSIFALEHARPRHGGQYLVTRIEVRGEQQGVLPPGVGHGLPLSGTPYRAAFECARRGKGDAAAESHYRPARVTPRPRIHGTQTAFVTAEPGASGAEIHIGGPAGAEIGCVRLKFHWDRDAARQAKEPTSCWVRVNQVFAGVGEGAVFHPRIGVEVIVEFEEGDPDRPIVVGRVYNGRNRPPTTTPTVSTFKSMTSPGDGTFNEITLDDTAGSQQIKLHTPKDWNSEVGNDRSETVAANSTSAVGANRDEATGADRSTMVGGNNAEMVSGNEQVTIGGNQNVGVGGDQGVSVTGSQSVAVEGLQEIMVVGDRIVTVRANVHETVEKARTVSVKEDDHVYVEGEQEVSVTKKQRTDYGADHELSVTGSQSTWVKQDQSIGVDGKQTISVKGDQTLAAENQVFDANAKQTLNSDTLSISATTKATIGSKEVVIGGEETVTLSGKKLVISFDEIEISGKQSVKISGQKVEISGSSIAMDGGQEVTVQAAIIKLN